MYRFNDISKHDDIIVLEGISLKDEEGIDNLGFFERKEGVNINKRDIYFYGEVNPDDKDDAAILERQEIVDKDLRHSWIPCHFHYGTGTGDTRQKTPTANPVTWFKYCHCRIGKPKRVIAYKINPKLL